MSQKHTQQLRQNADKKRRLQKAKLKAAKKARRVKAKEATKEMVSY